MMLIEMVMIVVMMLLTVAVARYTIFSLDDIDTYSTGIIKKYGSMNTLWIGCYDDKLYNSIYHYAYGVLAKGYKNNIFETVWDLLLKFADDSVDENNIIHEAIQDAYTEIVSMLDEAKRLQIEESWSYSTCFDYTELPTTMQHNERINMDALIEKLNELFKEAG